MVEALIGFAAALTMALLRVPLAFAMGIAGAAGYAILVSPQGAAAMTGRILIDAAQNYGLSVIPLFILMGMLAEKGGVSRELYRAGDALLGRFRGGLAMATVAACGGFSAICGSSLATAAAMAKVALPEMRRYGYADSLSAASIAAGGTLGILIPPSVILVIYGILTETSIAKLFVAGAIPGLLGIVLYIAAVKASIVINPDVAPPPPPPPAKGERIRAFKGVWATLLLFFAVIGGLYGVFDVPPLNLTFSPTEAAAMGAGGALLIALARRALPARELASALSETAAAAAALFAVLIGAKCFSNFVNVAGMADALLELIRYADVSPLGAIVVMMAIYILLGCVFESLSMMVLTVPIFFPLAVNLGFDPVWFGILVAVVTEISLITPPIGLNVFVLRGVAPDVPAAQIFKGVTPFWIADIIRLALLVAFPAIALFLPGRMG